MAGSSLPLPKVLRLSPLSVASTPKSPALFFSTSLPIPRFPKLYVHPSLLQHAPFISSRPRVSCSCSAQDDHRRGLAPTPPFLHFLTSQRLKVLVMITLALLLCSIDRVLTSLPIAPLSHAWNQSMPAVLQSSFLWGYLVTPIAGGALVDYYGGKTVLAWGVALWSLATFLTPWAAASSFWALLATRAAVGMAQGVALPCMNSVISRWFPRAERARAVGIAMAGFTLGNPVGLVLSPTLMSQAGKFGPFVIFGLSGLLWVLVWLSATSSSPERSSQISKYELNYILSKRAQSIQSSGDEKPRSRVIPPFRMLLSKLPTWAIIVANAMHAWGFFVILLWLPIHFNSVYPIGLIQEPWVIAVPWSLMAVIGYFACSWSDFLIHRGISITAARKIMQSIGFIGPSIALIGLTASKNPTMDCALLNLALGLKSFSHSGFFVNAQEIAPEYTGVLSGFSTTAGTVATIVGTVGAWELLKLVGSFQRFLLLTSLLYILAAIFWLQYSTADSVNFKQADNSLSVL